MANEVQQVAPPDGARTDRPLVLLERIDRDGIDIALLTLNRPEEHNPVDEPTIAELIRLLRELVDAGKVRAIVLTGAGPSFSSGGDLKKYQEMFRDAERQTRFVHAFSEACF